MAIFYKFIIFILLIFQVLLAQIFKVPKIPTIDDFIIDTLYVELSQDSILSDFQPGLLVLDTRDLNASILDIQQIEKYKVIPVDQYITLYRPLTELFTEQFSRDSVEFTGVLYISSVKIWKDKKPALSKGRRLNAYTILYDENENPVSDWLWEISVDKVRKEKEADQLGRMVEKWLDQQSTAIKNRDYNQEFYPYLFRRQLMVWTDIIVFTNGFALNAHLTLDFPPDQEKKWVRGAPGLYYRKDVHHESIAIGGMDQQWYKRINDKWLIRFTGTGRFGFNNFDNKHYSHLDPWNIVFLNLSSLVSLDYRPVYHRGVYGGIGLFNSFNILPEVIDRYELGLSFMLGVILP